MTVLDSEILNSIDLEIMQYGIRLAEKPWEAALLHRNVVALNWDVACNLVAKVQREETQTKALSWLQAKLHPFKPCLLTTRISALNGEVIRALENDGFNLMECYLELEHTLKRPPSSSGKNLIRPFHEREIAYLERIAYESFCYSRFHMDPQITSHEANLTRSEWVRNACLGRADVVLVAEADSKPIGFLVGVKKTSDLGPIGKIDLVAVDSEYRNRKVGYELTIEFINYCRSQRYCLGKVGTQAHNIPSLRIYEKVGFLAIAAFYSYHKHLI